MIRVVVFDFDGTLVDSNGIKRACMRKVVAAFPGGATALERALGGGGDRYRIFADVARRLHDGGRPGAVGDTARTLIARYSACCARGIIAAKERRGARAALAQLRSRGLKLWIASATPANHLPELLRRRDLMRFLDGALGGPASKAQNLRTVLVRERIGPANAIMVGDGMDDLIGARAVGLRFVAIDAEQRINEPYPLRIPDLTSLVPLIDRLRSRPIRRGVRR